jgi:hypothetical protein
VSVLSLTNIAFPYDFLLFRPEPKRAKKNHAERAPTGVIAKWRKVVAAKEKARLRKPPSIASTVTTTVTRVGTVSSASHDRAGDGQRNTIEEGGFASEEEGDFEPLENSGGSKLPNKRTVRLYPRWWMINITFCKQSLTRIKDIHAAPTKSGRSLRMDGRARVTNSDLPPGTADRFTKDLLPIVHDTAGALSPWESPSDEHIIEIWNLVFGDDHPIDSDKDEHFATIRGLVCSTSLILCSPLTLTFTGKARTLGVAPQVCLCCRKSAAD